MEYLIIAGQFLNILLVPVTGITVAVYRQLRALNGRLIRQEEWRQAHTKADEKDFAEIDRRITRVEDTVWNRHRT